MLPVVQCVELLTFSGRGSMRVDTRKLLVFPIAASAVVHRQVDESPRMHNAVASWSKMLHRVTATERGNDITHLARLETLAQLQLHDWNESRVTLGCSPGHAHLSPVRGKTRESSEVHAECIERLRTSQVVANPAVGLSC